MDDQLFRSEALKGLSAAARTHPEQFTLLRHFRFKDQTQANSDFDLNSSLSRSSRSSSGAEVPELSIEETLWDIANDPLPEKPEPATYLEPMLQDAVLTEASASRTELLDFLESCELTHPFLKFMLVEEQKDVLHSSYLFREESIGIGLLRELWMRRDGAVVIEKLIRPVVDKIAALEKPLEIDPNKTKKGKTSSTKKLIKLATSFIKEFISNFEGLMQGISLPLLKFVHSECAKKFPDVNMGAVVFIRFICPVLVSPASFIEAYKSKEIPAHTQRTLILLARILQRIANYTFFDEVLEAYMQPVNAAIKKLLPDWRAFWYKLLTDKELAVDSSVRTLNVGDYRMDEIAASFVAASAAKASNQNARCSDLLLQVKEDIKTALFIEEMTLPNTIILKKLEFRWNLDKASTLTPKATSQNLSASLQKVFDFVRETAYTQISDVNIEGARVVEQISDCFLVRFGTQKIPFSSKKDLVLLQYAEILPEQKLAIVMLRSIKRDDIPFNRPQVKFLAGFVIRQMTTHTQVIFVESVDGVR
eukprot:TRINITY_DN10127_c0_g1_i2.p1 TRINITY_DN10127_c0_g1~~TRINITY_DN10127_c0_g1_i2.p1  ORF type:complete len:534 (-),score=105.89 TRINITY_DN10127_c0_g1_i2:323-1924(-)